ncbi:hypothetical protein FK531_13260 [Rhodococcus spelaei]|uniref:Alcohol dehydrogenase n=1 Tax=Rhodococcus spelaei TaxID=2546320 RepID=A0A541B8V2_9NOCA|nr:hypothetical protein [Rhodococcus spelaei]TQF68762.1 hypothetical protein FK531_13260 [Rhodococcus spelaei]
MSGTMKAAVVHEFGKPLTVEEALDFYDRGRIVPTVHSRKLDDINDIFDELRAGTVDGRMVLDFR